ncbi:MAG: cation:proton antiporter [Desulfurococcales archaeon]|nr:cation:proton antiporter [Desulfurococcales archaeon]
MDVVTQLLGIIVPLLALAAFVIPLLSLYIKKKGFFDVYVTGFSTLALLISFFTALKVINTGKPLLYAYGGWPPPLGISYEIDSFNAVLGVLTAGIMWFIVLYSVWYSSHMDSYVWYYTLLLGLETGLLGCLYTGDAFNLFVMIEVLSISAYGLVAYYRNKPQAIEAAIKYGMIGAVATTLYFLALVFIYASFGTLNMADISLKAHQLPFFNLISNDIYGHIMAASAVALALALWAFTFKSALFPNHFWLPDAHPEAPTPVSAALSGLVVNVGVYAIIRFMYTIFGKASIVGTIGFRDVVLWALLILGIVSGLVGALLMIVQSDVKRLLAYSTISHIGLIYMGASIGLSSVSQESMSLGLTAALFHIINHSVGKALLFMATGILIWAAGTRDLDKMSGIGRLYPAASLAILLGFFQLMGLPPFGGFFSKLLLYQALISAGLIIPAVMVILISAISILGYIKAMYALIFLPPGSEMTKKPGTGLASAVVLVLGVTCIILGILAPFYIIPWLNNVVSTSLTYQGVLNYINVFREALLKLMPG